MADLLSRFAQNSFWMARYMERAENLARILDVNETFARDGRGAHYWLPVVQLNSDMDAFFKIHTEADAEAVSQFYLFDRENPNSILCSLAAARHNARSLRHLISTELWTHLNVFYNRFNDLSKKPVAISNLSRVCTTIKEDCQLHTGIAEGTLYRDQGWLFYRLGKMIERADQITRLLDIKYHHLLPRPEDVGTQTDVSQWNAVLRSAAGYHAFRRRHPRGMNPKTVAGFLLFSDRFPRSARVCVREIEETLIALRDDEELATAADAIRVLSHVQSATDGPNIDQVIDSGLHEFLDGIQRHLISLTDAVDTAFFGADT